VTDHPGQHDELDARLRSVFAPDGDVIDGVVGHALTSGRRSSSRLPFAMAAATAVLIAVVALVVLRSDTAEARPSVRLTGVRSVAVASSPDGEIWLTNRIESLPKGGSLIVVQPVGGE